LQTNALPSCIETSDVMDALAGEHERAQTAGDERLCPYRCARRGDAHPIEVADAFLPGELGRELDEELRLQLGEPR
jgi:hypothetical protein